MTAITELGYARFGVSSLEEWRACATDLVGLEIGDDSEPGRVYLRNDLWHHRIVLEEDGTDDLLGVGLRVPDRRSSRRCGALVRTRRAP